MYGESIVRLCHDILHFFDITDVNIEVDDSGALPFVIAARLEAVIKKYNKTDKEYLLPFSEKNRYYTKPDTDRVSRLYLPGNNPKLMINAGIYGSNCIILDLEDSVAPDRKHEARFLVRNALRSVDFYGAERMVRINQLPQGLEVRPVTPDQWRLIHDVSNEAFRDHWGARDESEEEYQRSLTEPIFRPELWMVAWDGDQIASVIHNFINEEENTEFKRRRGYTEGILTRRPWRKRGIARALLVRSMKMFKDMGMTETALGVDSQNLSGAFRLYEGVGYRKVNQQILYRKPIV